MTLTDINWVLRDVEWIKHEPIFGKAKYICRFCGRNRESGSHAPTCRWFQSQQYLLEMRQESKRLDEIEKAIAAKREKAKTAVSIENRPQQIENPDLTELRAACQEYVDFQYSEDWYEDEDDLDNYVFEAALEAFYGKGIFENHLNKIEHD